MGPVEDRLRCPRGEGRRFIPFGPAVAEACATCAGLLLARANLTCERAKLALRLSGVAGKHSHEFTVLSKRSAELKEATNLLEEGARYHQREKHVSARYSDLWLGQQRVLCAPILAASSNKAGVWELPTGTVLRLIEFRAESVALLAETGTYRCPLDALFDNSRNDYSERRERKKLAAANV